MKIIPIAIDRYGYDLPKNLIAEFPLPDRDASRLLVFEDSQIKEDHFNNLPQYLAANSMVLLNDSKVIQARLVFSKPSGGTIELFCLEPYGIPVPEGLRAKNKVQWRCLIGGASKWKKGQILEKKIRQGPQGFALFAAFIAKKEDYFIVEFCWSDTQIDFFQILWDAGSVPLPPYIKRKPVGEDSLRYQTIFAEHPGSVAAPTAALHFSSQVFKNLTKKNINCGFITLHVGAGTFSPLKQETIDKHIMHSEPFLISKKVLMGILDHPGLVAIGTTSLRAIESIYWIGLKLMQAEANPPWYLDQWEPYQLMEKMPAICYQDSLGFILKWMEDHQQEEVYCYTSLMVIPGYPFKIVHGLVTNFHQPKSTLLVLISAFIGNEWENVYAYALRNKFRFLSYGDSSLLWRKT
ncbi:MAG: S-adenosylmethionine:tRNA ribosyltransferase-isomerase [Flavisolibacter sp.]